MSNHTDILRGRARPNHYQLIINDEKKRIYRFFQKYGEYCCTDNNTGKFVLYGYFRTYTGNWGVWIRQYNRPESEEGAPGGRKKPVSIGKYIRSPGPGYKHLHSPFGSSLNIGINV